MRHFWSIYLTAAVAGTAGVYFLAPLARPFLAERGVRRASSSVPVAHEEGAVVPAQEPAALSVTGVAEEPVRAPARLGIRLVSRGDVTPSWGMTCRPAEYFMMDGLSTGRLEAGKKIDFRSIRCTAQGPMVEFMVDSPVGIPTTPYLVSPTNLFLFTGSYSGLTGAQVEELKDVYALRETALNPEKAESARPPKGILLVQRGDVAPAWGVVRQQANYYWTDGRRAGLVDAGALVEYRKAVPSPKGLLADCLICVTNGSAPARALIRQKDLHLFTGSYGELSAAQVKDVRTYYELAGKKSARRTELLQASAAKNPFFSAYRSAYQALMAHVEKNQAALDCRDRAVDDERVQAQARLYELRMDERRLRIVYEEAEKKFKDWKKAHAEELQAPDEDPDMALWSKLQRMLAPGIAGLAF